VDPTINCGTTTGYKKQLIGASWDEKTHEHAPLFTCGFSAMNSGAIVPAGPFRFNAKNALNQVQPNKIKKYFLFLIVFYSEN
jgi:hypothetical protein